MYAIRIYYDIAQRQGISLSYLEQLFSRLRKRSLVSSVRGPGGGYSLGKSAGEIFIGEVISAVDENMDTTRCHGAHNCQNNERCLTHDLWADLSDQIYNYLNNISLQDLMDVITSYSIHYTKLYDFRMP